MSEKSAEDDLFKAAQITVVFLALYALTFVKVLVTKKQCLRANKKFDRYTSPQMYTADRLNANFLEWSPIFLGLLWSLSATQNLSEVSVLVSWTYVALRALYMILILRHGVALDGMNKKLWISTFPAYFCLIYLSIEAIRVLFF